MAFIYSLTHPSSSRLYIGKTIQTLKRRLYGHMDESNRHPNLRKNRWIRSLIKNGLTPEIKVIAEVSDEKLDEYEIYYIKLAKQVAPNDILNSPNMIGGEGFKKGHNISKKARKRSALHRRKFTNEELQKIADRLNSGEYMKDIAKEYDVHYISIARNLNGKTTNSNNIVYKIKRASGIRHGMSKITQEIANAIREKYSSSKIHQYELAKEFGITQANVWSIIRNKTWKDNSKNYTPKIGRRLLSNEQLEIIASRINNGELIKDLVKEYRISNNTIWRGLNGKVTGAKKIKYEKVGCIRQSINNIQNFNKMEK